MPLLPLDDVKTRFPRWQSYCTFSQSDTAADASARLEQALRQAEGELLDYVQIEAATMTERLERHLMNITRFNAFDAKYGSEDYDTKPTIVRRYEQTIETLRGLRAGEHPDPYDPTTADSEDERADVRFTSKPRRFDEWFTDPDRSLQ